MIARNHLNYTMTMRLALTFLIFVSPALGYTQIISNGGFENGIDDDWIHLEGNGSAKFIEEHYHVREGSNSLRVKVEAVSQTGYVRSANKSFSNTGKGTYLLRFWAISDSDRDLHVSVEGDENDVVHFELRDKWHLYHLPFDTESEAIDLRFIYPEVGYYVIDGVEILDQNSGIIDVEQTYKWNEKYVEGWGWIAGDNDISLELPDGRTVYFFNDSFYGYNDPTENPFQNNGSRFLRNAMVVEEDGLLYSHYSGTQANTTRYFESVEPSPLPGVDNFYWVGDAVMHEGHVLVYLVEVLNTSGGATATGRTYIASLSYPELELEGIFPQEDFANSYESFFAEGDYYYLYRTQAQGVWNSTTHVARCDRNDLLGTQGTWRFYNGTDWVQDPTESAAINNVRAESFARLQPGNYVQISMPVLSNEIKASFAPTPIGPWTEAQVIYYIPLDEEYWWYLPNIQHQLPNGKFQVSYSVNSWEGWLDAWKDKYWYRQRYIQVDLLGLSPYTQIERENLALDHPVTSSSDPLSAIAEQAVDGDLNSAWSAYTNTAEWIYVDLGSVYDVSQLKLIWGDNWPRKFQIGSSMDASHWTLYKTVEDNEYALNDLCAMRILCRYLGIRIQDAPDGIDLREMEVFGTLYAMKTSYTDRSMVSTVQQPFPVPFNDHVYVPLSSFTQDEEISIDIYDMTGKKHLTVLSTVGGKAFQRVDTDMISGSPLPPGVYSIEVIGRDRRESFRIVKE